MNKIWLPLVQLFLSTSITFIAYLFVCLRCCVDLMLDLILSYYDALARLVSYIL
jgi:hypothetical protein